MAKRVLVTGADGFIGSHLVEHLLDDGYEVKAFCQYNSFGTYGWLETISPNKLSCVEKVLGDIRDLNSVTGAMQGTDIVFHLAALIAIPYSYQAPNSYIETNISGTLNMLLAAKQNSVERIIITSTSEVYGTAKFVPITEEHPLQGQSPYSASKIGADQLAMSFYHSFELPVSILRPFNTYGPRQSQRAVIPTIITQIAAGKKIIKLGSLSPTRDFNYVSDTCMAFIALSKCDASIGQVINSASKFEVSIGETAEIIAEVMNASVEIVSDMTRVRPSGSEVNRLFGDNQKLITLTGWKPAYGGINGFKSGVRKTAEWFTDPKNLAKYAPDSYMI